MVPASQWTIDVDRANAFNEKRTAHAVKHSDLVPPLLRDNGRFAPSNASQLLGLKRGNGDVHAAAIGATRLAGSERLTRA